MGNRIKVGGREIRSRDRRRASQKGVQRDIEASLITRGGKIYTPSAFREAERIEHELVEVELDDSCEDETKNQDGTVVVGATTLTQEEAEWMSRKL